MTAPHATQPRDTTNGDVSPMENRVRRRRYPGLMVIAAALVVFALVEVTSRSVEPRLTDVSPWGQIGIENAVDDLTAAPNDALLLLGSSTVRRGIDPELLAEASSTTASAVNVAFDAASPRTVALLSEEVFLPRSDPSTVVIGLSTHDLNDNGLVQTTTHRRYTESSARLDAIGRLPLSGRVALRLGELSTFVRVRHQLRSPSSVFDAITAEGQQPRQGTYRPDGQFDAFWKRQVLSDYTVGGTEAHSLRRLIAAIQRDGATVIIVDMPIVVNDMVRLLPNGQQDLDAYRASVVSIASEYGVKVLWANDTPWDSTYFGDPAHLNDDGEDRFTRWLASELDRLATK